MLPALIADLATLNDRLTSLLHFLSATLCTHFPHEIGSTFLSSSSIIKLSESVYNILSLFCSKIVLKLVPVFKFQVSKRYFLFFDIIVVLTLKEY